MAEGSAGLVSFSGQADPSAADVAAGFSYSYDFDNDGTFELVGPEPHSSPEVLALPTEHILMEGLRQLDEMRHKQTKLPPPQSRLGVVLPLEARLAELSPAELDVFQLTLSAPITVQGVFDRAAVNDAEAAVILDKLLKKKYLTAEGG